MSKILVTGGAGYIGSHTVRALQEQGYDVLVFDNLSQGHRAAVPSACSFLEGDLNRAEDVERAFNEHAVEAIMHFAGLCLVGDSMRRPAHYYRHNVGQAALLLETALQKEVRRFIFSSSCAVYGEPLEIPMDEGHPCRPINPYGRSKRIVEQLLADCRQSQGLRYVSLRYFNAGGASLDGTLGESHDPETHLIPRVLQAADEGRAVEIYGDDYDTPDGTCLRDYVHVEDLASGHVAALRLLERRDLGDTFNLGTGKGISVLQVVEEARRVTGLPLKSKTAPRRPGDPAKLICDPSKAGSQLDWRPRHSDLATIMESAWRWEKSRRF